MAPGLVSWGFSLVLLPLLQPELWLLSSAELPQYWEGPWVQGAAQALSRNLQEAPCHQLHRASAAVAWMVSAPALQLHMAADGLRPLGEVASPPLPVLPPSCSCSQPAGAVSGAVLSRAPRLMGLIRDGPPTLVVRALTPVGGLCARSTCSRCLRAPAARVLGSLCSLTPQPVTAMGVLRCWGPFAPSHGIVLKPAPPPWYKGGDSIAGGPMWLLIRFSL